MVCGGHKGQRSERGGVQGRNTNSPHRKLSDDHAAASMDSESNFTKDS